jgi:hypothetical protein
MHKPIIAALLVTGLALSLPLAAKDDKKDELATPKLFDDVVACKAIENADERLACYDSKVAALDEAQKSKEIVVTDKAAIKEARRGLFGFDLPKIKIFGGDDEEELNEVEGAVSEAYMNRDGKLTIVLEDGARWSQIDSQKVRRMPKAGVKARIRRAAMGSFFVNIDEQRAIRMKRVN